MNILYAKTALYCYSCIDDFVDRLDEVVLRKAVSSINDYAPAIAQYHKIVDLSEQKSLYIILKKITKEALRKFTDDEMAYIGYKYFKVRSKNNGGFDFTSRAYYRTQVKLAKKFAQLLERKGITNEVFEKKYLKMDLILAIYRKVKEQEINASKNKAYLRAMLSEKEKI